MKPRALDANILLRFITADHPEMSPRCANLMQRLEEGREQAFLPEAALSDTAWTLRSFYRWPAEKIADFLGDLLALDSLSMHRKEMVWNAVELFRPGELDFSDALIAAEMASLELTELYSFDHDFDSLAAVRRIEP